MNTYLEYLCAFSRLELAPTSFSETNIIDYGVFKHTILLTYTQFSFSVLFASSAFPFVRLSSMRPWKSWKSWATKLLPPPRFIPSKMPFMIPAWMVLWSLNGKPTRVGSHSRRSPRRLSRPGKRFSIVSAETCRPLAGGLGFFTVL